MEATPHLALRHGGMTEPTSWLGQTNTIVVHGVLMLFAWGFLINVGTIIASYYKGILHQGKFNWFHLHIVFQSVAFALTILGFSLAFGHIQSQIDSKLPTNTTNMDHHHANPHLNSTHNITIGSSNSTSNTTTPAHAHAESAEEVPSHFRAWHPLIGLIVTLLILTQVILGISIHLLYDPKRSHPPILDRLHWYLGRLTLLLACCNLVLGFYSLTSSSSTFSPYSSLFYALLSALLLSLFLLYFIFSMFAKISLIHQKCKKLNFSKNSRIQGEKLIRVENGLEIEEEGDEEEGELEARVELGFWEKILVERVIGEKGVQAVGSWLGEGKEQNWGRMLWGYGGAVFLLTTGFAVLIIVSGVIIQAAPAHADDD